MLIFQLTLKYLLNSWLCNIVVKMNACCVFNRWYLNLNLFKKIYSGRVMEILAHRGFWKSHEEKNSLTAFDLALSMGFGLELDVRDLNGSIVISHDIPKIGDVDLFAALLELYVENGRSSCLALNIKSDGLQDLLMSLLDKYGIENYFFFDMSIPDMLGYFKKNSNVYMRISEIEHIDSILINQSKGIWLDSLMGDWITPEVLFSLAKHNRPICIVSPELHKRDFLSQWSIIRDVVALGISPHLFKICTDFPLEAKEFFK